MRLVALNLARTAEEKQGKVRWLRPEYQIPKLGVKMTRSAEIGEQMEADVTMPEVATLAAWPADGLEQIRIVRDILAKSQSPLDAAFISASFAGKNTATRKKRVAMVLETLVSTGAAQTTDASLYFIPKQ